MIRNISTFHYAAFEVFWKFVAENDPKMTRTRKHKEQKSVEALKGDEFSQWAYVIYWEKWG